MLNLEAIEKDSYEFLQEVIVGKKTTRDDPDYKTRLVALYPNLESLLNSYHQHFDANTLHLLTSFGYTNQDKIDLLKLYTYRNLIFQKLKTSVTTTETGRVINTCQNCTIGEVNSFDHIVPKDEFPEYVVNPKNLFPSCTKCNGHKLQNWRNATARLFLNLYIDMLPTQQYLFVELTFSHGSIQPRFYIDNRHGVDGNLFTLILSHYTRLQLFTRFNQSSDTVIVELMNSLQPFIGVISRQVIIDTTSERIERNRQAFGQNYWKSILELALINHADFLTRVGL